MKISWSGRAHKFSNADIKYLVEIIKNADPMTQGSYLKKFEKNFSKFIGSILSIPFDMFKWMGEKIIDSFEKYEAKEIGQGIFGFFCCCILPLFLYWKFKKSKSKISTAAAPAAAPAPAPVAATAAIAV